MAQRIKPIAALLALLAIAFAIGCDSGTKLPDGFMSEKKSQQLVDKTMTVRLESDLSHLSDAERETIDLLMQIGDILHALYEQQRHYEARDAYAELLTLHEELGEPVATQNLIDIYRRAKGPIVRRFDDNKLAPFLPVEERPPGGNVYPWGVTREELDAFIGDDQARREDILHLRRVVRRTEREWIDLDLSALAEHELVRNLHPELETKLQSLLADGAPPFYTVPYSVAYASELVRVHHLLNQAAKTIEPTDRDFAGYLRHRALDLLRDDYEAGDAAWVTGRFGNLNAQIGSYETYDDGLYGVKTYFSTCVLIKERAMASSVESVLSWIQEIEDILPYDHHKKVRTDIPISAYEVVADYGQSRGTNTATILPNEAYITRKYGRTILLRYNIMMDEGLFAARRASFEAAVAPQHHAHYNARGDYFRTLFHEIGHYLGVDQTADGGNLDIALEETSSVLEELKADLVSLYAAKRLFKKGFYNEDRLNAVQTSGIRRLLRKNEPGKTAVYSKMQNMQLNYYLEKGMLEYDARANKLIIHTDQYHQAVESMLREVLELQYRGDKAAAVAFIEKYSTWDDNVQVKIAQAMKDAETYRWGLVRYAAFGE